MQYSRSKNSSSHCVVSCYPLVNQTLLLPPCTSLRRYNSSNHGPSPTPTALPISPLPINQSLQSYWLTEHHRDFPPPTISLSKQCFVVVVLNQMWGAKEGTSG
jgi:hypothetical protein